MKKIKEGTRIFCDNGLFIDIVSKDHSHADGPSPATVTLNLKGAELKSWLDESGIIPLPPYIKRDVSDLNLREKDQKDTKLLLQNTLAQSPLPQLVFISMKTLIRPFTDKGITIKELTLHVGAGTFLPVKADDPSNHLMHEEMFYIPEETLCAILEAKKQGREIITVGTTSMRSLEALVDISKKTNTPIENLTNTWLSTDLFIYPKDDDDRYKPNFATGMITNFHQPESTLFMLISALVGRNNAVSFYEDSIDKGARLFSYGDSSLLIF